MIIVLTQYRVDAIALAVNDDLFSPIDIEQIYRKYDATLVKILAPWPPFQAL